MQSYYITPTIFGFFRPDKLVSYLYSCLHNDQPAYVEWLDEAACAEILKDKNIKILNLADESEEPLSLTLTGDAVVSVIRPIASGITANRNQLVAIKEQLLAAVEAEMTAK